MAYMTVRLSEDNKFLVNSKSYQVKENERYRTVCRAKAGFGKPYSVFFGVFVLDSRERELARFRRWINNFDGLDHDYEIIFSPPYQSKYVQVGYRINTETFHKSRISVELQDIDSVKVEEYHGDAENSFDRDSDYAASKQGPLNEVEEERLERNLIWVFGYQRSGTTWLGRDLLALNLNPYWHEPKIAWHLSQWYGLHYQDEYLFSRIHKSNWILPFRKFVLARIYSQFSSIDKPIVIKEPSPHLGTDLLMECFPKSRFIFILRDARDVIDSILDSHSPGSWRSTDPIHKLEPLSDEESRLKAIKYNAEDWRSNISIIAKAFERHDQNLRLLVRYEHLRENTFEELKKIYHFIGLKFSDEEINNIVRKYAFESIPDEKKGPGKFYRVATPGAWRVNFNEKEKELIESVIGSTQRQFGYT